MEEKTFNFLTCNANIKLKPKLDRKTKLYINSFQWSSLFLFVFNRYKYYLLPPLAISLLHHKFSLRTSKNL